MKKTTCALLAFGGVFCANLAFAQTTLSFPKTVEILAVNGKEISKPRRSIQLPDGKTQLLVRLAVDVGRRFDPDMEYSQPVIMTFSAENEQLALTPPKIKSAHDMRLFNQKMDLTLIDAKGNPVSFTKDELVKSGLQFNRDYEQELSQYNQGSAPAALSTQMLPAQQGKAAIQNTPAISGDDNSQAAEVEKEGLQKREKAAMATSQPISSDQAMAKEMLYYWYEKADKKTRQEFLQAIKGQ